MAGLKESMERAAWLTKRNVVVGVRPYGDWFVGGIDKEWDVSGPLAGARQLLADAEKIAAERLQKARLELTQAEKQYTETFGALPS